MACSMGTSVGYDRARNKVSGGPMAHPLAHCQLESRFQSDTFVSTLLLEPTGRAPRPPKDAVGCIVPEGSLA